MGSETSHAREPSSTEKVMKQEERGVGGQTENETSPENAKFEVLGEEYVEHPVAISSESDDDYEVDSLSDEESDEEDDEEEEEEDEEDEDFNERLAILDDCHKLKFFANAYTHPEEPVKKVDPTCFGRNYFDRASASDVVPEDDAEERAQLLADVKALKTASAAYLHAEIGVKMDDAAGFGRNYFNRASAPAVVPDEEFDEGALILADAKALKAASMAYMHPEVGVKGDDPTCYGRNYFNRPSGPVNDKDGGEDEREKILEDAAALKEMAVMYLHSEQKVQDGVGGRCYFERASALDVQSDEDAEECAGVLSDALALKEAAAAYMHPEEPMKTLDPACFGRNYFERVSAPDVVPEDDAEERARVLADGKALKNASAAYLHPEVDVKAEDATCFGRNYFNRPSASANDEGEEEDDLEELAQILEDAKGLKSAARAYMHPETGVKTDDATCFGRNYFNRASAPDVISDEAEEGAQVLVEVEALKAASVAYLHPEIGVKTEDPTCFGRNFFDRSSAPHVSDGEAETAQILEDAKALKAAARAYMHPETGVKTDDATCFGRNYFNRASAPDVISDEAEEGAQVLVEVEALKTASVAYLHPEIGIKTEDPACFGRNFFDRSSASHVSDDEVEIAQILEDAKALKAASAAYLHPEVGVKLEDPTCFGRSFFNRPSAVIEDVSNDKERAQVLADAMALKRCSAAYLHPEIGVKMEDPTCFGRGYFGRPSVALEEVSDEERARVLEEAAVLAETSRAWLHPEAGVKTSDPASYGRTYYSRPSAPEYVTEEEANEHAQILADAKNLKEEVVGYMHPEVGVKAEDATCFGRNYFTRPSAVLQDGVSDGKERATVLKEAAVLAENARAWLHPETGVKTSDPSCFGRNFFSRPSAPDHEVGDIVDEFAAGEEFEQVRKESESDEYFEMDLEEEVDLFSEVRQSFARHIPRPPTPTDQMERQIIDTEEEVNLSRSPSSVMLFDTAEGNLSRKASTAKLSSMGDGNLSRKSSSPYLAGVDGNA